MAYAVLLIGGRQYRVQVGDTIEVDRRVGEEGQTLTWDEVMMLKPSIQDGEPSATEKASSAINKPTSQGRTTSPFIGEPFVEGAQVQGVIAGQGRSPKILVFKKKRRKGYKRLKGHKQPVTTVKITHIRFPGSAVQ